MHGRRKALWWKKNEREEILYSTSCYQKQRERVQERRWLCGGRRMREEILYLILSEAEQEWLVNFRVWQSENIC